MKNIKQAQRLIRSKLEIDQILNQISKEQSEQRRELGETLVELNQAFHFKNFKKIMNQILIGLLKDKGLKPERDYRINDYRLYLDKDDTLLYKGYAQKLKRELDVFSDLTYKILEREFLEPEFIALLERGKALKNKMKSDYDKSIEENKILIESKMDETYNVPSWRSGKLESVHVQKIYIKINLLKYQDSMSCDINNINKTDSSNYYNDSEYSRNEYLSLYPSYRNTAKKVIQQGINKINKIKQKVIQEESKLTKNIPTKYATYLLLRGIAK